MSVGTALVLPLETVLVGPSVVGGARFVTLLSNMVVNATVADTSSVMGTAENSITPAASRVALTAVTSSRFKLFLNT